MATLSTLDYLWFTCVMLCLFFAFCAVDRADFYPSCVGCVVRVR